jgi:hypothetical protein
MKTRQYGVYWVLIGADWRIAEFACLQGQTPHWYLTGDEVPCDEREFLEIDERQIHRSEASDLQTAKIDLLEVQNQMLVEETGRLRKKLSQIQSALEEDY